MHILFMQALLLLLAASCFTTAIPLSDIASGTFLVSPDTNTITGLGVPEHRSIDPRFGGHVANPGSEILDTDTGLLAMTQMMYQLSLKDFNGIMAAAAWVSGTSELVSVEIRLLPGRFFIPVRYAVWGAQLLSRHMLLHREVRNVAWALTWDRAVIGSIWLERRPPAPLRVTGSGGGADEGNPVPSTDASFRMESQLRAAAAAVPGDETTISLPLRDDRVTVQYRMIRNKPMTEWELFANIFGILGFVSSFPPREKSRQTWVYTSNIFPETHISYLPERDVEYQYRAVAAYSTAVHIVQNRLFFSLALTIRLDGEVVCKGAIYKGNVAPGLLPGTTE